MKRLMPASAGVAIVLLALAGCTAPAPEPVVDVSAKSAALADRFQADLQGQLQAAMKADGPVGAIGVCQQAAPAIAASLSEESGAEVRRIALKERNPAAAPEGELRKRLEQMAIAPLTADGKPSVMQWTSGSGADARAHFMRAIPMKEQPCAVCHGTSIAPEVKDKLATVSGRQGNRLQARRFTGGNPRFLAGWRSESAIA